MILITSTFGPTRAYRDRSMMLLTLSAWLRSLATQTDQEFRVFLALHDWPEELGMPRWLEPVYAAPPGVLDYTVAFDPPPITGEEKKSVLPWSDPTTDMSRKTYLGLAAAGAWARAHLRDFWLLRMDSDDLLARDVVTRLHALPKHVQAVYSRRALLIDPKQRRLGIQSYPHSLTCNALRYRVTRDGFTPSLWYHATDHTRFMGMVHRDQIPALEEDFMLGIITNSGNSISNRPPVEQEKYTTLEVPKEIYGRFELDQLVA